MSTLAEKLNYKGQERIAILNAGEEFHTFFASGLKYIQIDKEIDPRFPYGFVIVFVKSVANIEKLTPVVLHNLIADGILWFCYPKKTSKKAVAGLDRDHGWKALDDLGFRGIRTVSIDENWSAFRFRNVKYIKSKGACN